MSCQRRDGQASSSESSTGNLIRHAKGLEIQKFEGFSIIKIRDPWPGANRIYTYVCQRDGTKIPDSLSKFGVIKVPVSSIAVTSTTHIPSLEMLGVHQNLTAFPNLDYISSVPVRNRIDRGEIRDIGEGYDLNTEIIIDVAPDVLVAHAIDDSNPEIELLRKSGLKVLFNGDWNEKTPLGKAEWIKLFGTLFAVEDKADSIFNDIEKEYTNAVKLASTVSKKPTVLSGSMYENTWFVPQGGSWGSLLLKDAGADYLWADSKGTGSLSLSFEVVYDKASEADFWIGPAEHTSLADMLKSKPHYNRFKAFQTKNVYSFSTKKGRTGGVIYYELSQNRPDLVIKDLIHIFHPTILPDHKLVFFEKLK